MSQIHPSLDSPAVGYGKPREMNMIRIVKALGPALVAVLAMGALVAANASAASFHSEVERTILTGENESGTQDVIKAGSFEVTCNKSTYSGTSVGGGASGNFVSSSITLHPTYSGCSDNVFGGTDTISTTGCSYIFEAETNATKHLPTSIECTTGFAIKIIASGCTLSFGTQLTSGGEGVKNEGVGSSRDITLTTTFKFKFTKSGFSCGLISATEAEYTGKTTLKGYIDNGVTGEIDEAASTAVYTEGAQVGIWWQ